MNQVRLLRGKSLSRAIIGGVRSVSGLLPICLLASLASIDAAAAVSMPQLVQVSGHGIPGMYFGTARAADVTGDGLPDVLMAGSFKTGDHVRIYKNISSGGQIRFELLQSVSIGADSAGHLEVVTQCPQ